MHFVIGYVAFLIAFGICDAVWLGTMTAKLYRPALGDLIVEQVRLWPAALFYFGFPLGVIHFALMPALAEIDPVVIDLSTMSSRPPPDRVHPPRRSAARRPAADVRLHRRRRRAWPKSLPGSKNPIR